MKTTYIRRFFFHKIPYNNRWDIMKTTCININNNSNIIL